MSPEQAISLGYQQAYRDKRAARALAMRQVRAAFVEVSQLTIAPNDPVFEPTQPPTLPDKPAT